MPAARLLYLLAATTALGIVGVLEPAFGWLALGLDGVLLVASALDWRAASQHELTAERTWPELLAQGQPETLRVTLENGPRAVVLQLREALSPALARSPRRTELRLAADETALWRVPLAPRRRGVQETGSLDARTLGPWRLAWSQRRLIAPETVRVLPQVRWEGRVGRLLLLAHRGALGQHPQQRRGLGTEPYALREYQAGDPPTKIHWKASARHGRLVSREDTWERGARLVILLDCGRGMADVDHESAERSKLDHALAAALALARVAAARGDRVAIVAFSDRIERVVRLRGGARGVRAAYSALYDLEPRHVEPAFDLAVETAASLESRRSTVMLFTSVVDLAATELLQGALLRLERRHLPILLNLRDPELVALAAGAPDAVDEAFAKVSALEIGLANRRLSMRLRRAGVRVVAPSADRLALEAVDHYLELFGAGPARSRAAARRPA